MCKKAKARVSITTVCSFADESFTLLNILSVTEGIEDLELLGLLLGLGHLEDKIEKIKQQFKDPAAQRAALLRLWHETHPLASWSLLQQALSMLGHKKAAKAVQEKFLGGEDFFKVLVTVVYTSY